MLRITITTKDGNAVWLDFSDQSSVDAYVAGITASQHWGQNAYTAITVQGQAAVLDDQGNVVTPAVAQQTQQVAATWSYVIADITAQVAAAQALAQGLQAQQVGATAVAQVWALNEAKFAAGTLSSADFQAILADTSLQMIERLLWNGSLKTAKSMIQAYSGVAFSSSDKSSVIAILDASGLD